MIKNMKMENVKVDAHDGKGVQCLKDCLEAIVSDEKDIMVGIHHFDMSYFNYPISKPILETKDYEDKSSPRFGILGSNSSFNFDMNSISEFNFEYKAKENGSERDMKFCITCADLLIYLWYKSEDESIEEKNYRELINNKYKELDFLWCKDQLLDVISKYCDNKKIDEILKTELLPNKVEEEYYDILMSKAEELNPDFEEWIDGFHNCVAGDREQYAAGTLNYLRDSLEKEEENKNILYAGCPEAYEV